MRSPGLGARGPAADVASGLLRVIGVDRALGSPDPEHRADHDYAGEQTDRERTPELPEIPLMPVQDERDDEPGDEDGDGREQAWTDEPNGGGEPGQRSDVLRAEGLHPRMASIAQPPSQIMAARTCPNITRSWSVVPMTSDTWLTSMQLIIILG
jgi:hypothetical protein